MGPAAVPRLPRPARRSVVVAGVVLVAGYVLAAPWLRAQALVYLLGASTCTAAVALGGLRASRHRGRPWLLVAAGLATWVVGFGWYLAVRAGAGAVPAMPSLGDVFHLAGYPLVIAGAFALTHPRWRRGDVAAFLDTAIVGTAMALAAWLFVTPTLDPDASTAVKVLSITYPLLDVAMVSVVVQWLLAGAARSPAARTLAVAVVLLVVGDVTYVVAAAAGADLLVAASALHLGAYVAVAAGALDPAVGTFAAGTLTRSHAADVGHVSRTRVLLLVCVGVAVPFAGAVKVASGDRAGADVGVLVVTWVAIVCLAGARLAHVSSQVQAERARRLASHRFRAAFDATVAGMALVGIDGPNRGRLLEVNSALARMTGRAPQALAGISADDLLLPSPEPGLLEALDRLHGWRHTLLPTERRLATDRGREVCVRLGLAELDGESFDGRCAVLHVEDVTEQRMVTEQLAQRAMYDPLTGLPNRTMLDQRTESALATMAQTGEPVAVLVVGLDRFALVNDSQGHDAADGLLVETGRRLRATVPGCEVVARLGGDEFAVLLLGAGAAAAQAAGAAVVRAVAEPVRTGAAPTRVTASVGLAVARRDDGAESLLHHADVAMRQAKVEGRARVLRFDDALRGAADERIALEVDLRDAVTGDALHLAYQPILDLGSEVVVAHEALLRWRRRRGDQVVDVPPGEFLPVAEESGLVLSLGRQALARALRDLPGLSPADRQHQVCVNLAARQLAEEGFAGTVLGELERQGVEPDRLCLEITENTLIERMDLVAPALHELRHEGVTVALDDFGTGFSSLTHLRYFPVDVVKIDRSFVAGVTSAGPDERIVSGVVELAHALGLSTVAEGIETAEQLAVLRELGCDHAQGFYLGRPAPLAPLDPLDPQERGGSRTTTTSRTPRSSSDAVM